MPEVRLIDANTLKREVKTECNPYGKPTIGFDDGCKFMNMIDEQPTIEAKPVRHGRWIQQESPNGGSFNCSECGHEFTVPCSEMIDPRDYECYLDKYCGNCGAKMFQNGGFITKERLAEIMNDGTHGDCYFFDT